MCIEVCEISLMDILTTSIHCMCITHQDKLTYINFSNRVSNKYVYYTAITNAT